MNEILIITVLTLASAMGSWLLCSFAISNHYLEDQVTPRSSHLKATSRAGGICLIASFVLTVIGGFLLVPVQGAAQALLLVCLTMVATILGFVDDRLSLPAMVKFIGQIVLAIGVVTTLGGVPYFPLPFVGQVVLGPAGFFLGIFWVVAFINVFNFMDGLNGMAGCTAMVAALALAIASLATGRMDILLLSCLLSGALAGFLIHNLRGGRIFMGDGGSHGLGLLFAGLALIGGGDSLAGAAMKEIDFLLIPIIFLPFIIDVSLTLGRRAVAGAPLHQAHKEHFYQRLQQRGLAHEKVALLFATLAALCAVVGWLNGLLTKELQWLGPLSLVVVLAVGMVLADQRQIRR